MNATDIKEHREERPRLYGLFWQRTKFAGMWCGKLETDPPRSSNPSCGEVTFTIPSEREQKLLDERERAILSVLRTFPDDPDVHQVEAIDRQLSEMRGAK